MDELEKKLEYHFRDRKLLERALTHNSHGHDNNERLEFLGDATLGFVTATVLYSQYSDMSEGDMSILMSKVVSHEALTSAAKVVGLEKHIRISASAHAVNIDLILADAVEAIIAAVYLDGGLQSASRIIGKLLSDTIENNRIRLGKDAKTALQEWLQARKLALPTYNTVQINSAPARFRATCKAHDKTGEGEGMNKREAEMLAAQKVLSALTA